MAGKIRLLLWLGAARCTALVTPSNRAAMPRRGVALTGWLDAFLPAPMTDEEFEEDRRSRWPEQYAAVLDDSRRGSSNSPTAARDGWSAEAFHRGCDGRGACVVYAKTEDGAEVGAYNPKGWASMGNARPSPAAFLFRLRDGGEPLKLRSASHIGCNSISSDAPDRGIDFGLGVYYEGEGALWGAGQTTALAELKVFAGVYAPGEEYPYAGAVMDMTSG
ncbi:hypothetical protein JL720_8330 [Aureococcus anophagefferens]|nr:hypothetical protein JL720_8330 [Aureococcus anophagefferens]